MFQPLFGNFDNSVVVAINNCHSPLMDNVIMAVTGFWCFVAVVCALAVYAFVRDKSVKALLFVVLLLVAVGCADYLCASIIRPLVKQMRPSNPDNPINTMLHIVNGYRGGRYGLPSCHAANAFAIAIFASLWFRCRWLVIAVIFWALLECYTRLYLGVHYPSDILCGSAVGSLAALLVYRLSRPWRLRLSATVP